MQVSTRIVALTLLFLGVGAAAPASAQDFSFGFGFTYASPHFYPSVYGPGWSQGSYGWIDSSFGHAFPIHHARPYWSERRHHRVRRAERLFRRHERPHHRRRHHRRHH